MKNKCSQIRPWIRWWARYVDALLVMIILTPVLFYLPIESLETTPKFLSIFVFSTICIVIESILISFWGYTPGKRLFCVKVRKLDDKKLSFISSLKRAFSVWVIGEGMNLPIINCIMPILAYLRLKARKTTYWDEVDELKVEHCCLGIRPIVTTILLTFFFVGIFLFYSIKDAAYSIN